MAKETAVVKDVKTKLETTKPVPAKAPVAAKSEETKTKKTELVLPEGVVEVGKDHEGKAILQSMFNGSRYGGIDYVNEMPWSYVVPNSQNNPWIDQLKDGKLITTKILTDKEIAQLDLPYVVINGVKIEPVMTGLDSRPYDYWGWPSPQEAQQFTVTPDGSGIFSLYKVVVEGRKLSILIDNKSKFVIQDENTENGFYHGRYDFRLGDSRATPGSVTMRNSDARNTIYMGNNILENVSLDDCILNSARIVATRERQGHIYDDPGVDTSRFRPKEEQTEYAFDERTRHRYKGVKVRKGTLEDSEVPEGYYFNTSIIRSSLVSNKWVRVSDSRIVGSRIEAGTITIEKGTITGSSFLAQISFMHGSFVSHRERLSVSSAHLPNKFALARISMPDQDLTLVRISEKEFELALYTSGPRIHLDASREAVAEAVVELMSTTNYREDNNSPNVLTESIAKYVVDSIVSRLEVVNTIDAVMRMAQDISRNYPDGEDLFAPV